MRESGSGIRPTVALRILPMSRRPRSNLFLGLALSVLAAVVLFVWIPLDINTGVVEHVRTRFVIGDSAAPVMAGVITLLGASLLLTFERDAADQPSIAKDNLRFILAMLAAIALGLILMRYLGPVLVAAFGIISDRPIEYRLLRDTVPWKYLGYLTGGTTLIAGMIAVVERKLTLRAIVIGALASVVFIAIFDLPFHDLLLPPNGDV